MSRGDTIPNTPEHPLTPLEQMEEDDMRRIHPILPSNAALNAASDNGILLTDEQHRVLTSQSEGSTILYRPRENRQRVEADNPIFTLTEEERNALRSAHCQNLSLVLLGGGKAPRLSEVHCDRDSVCVKTDT